ncbi:hypothetical protein M2352_001766 [Azospirillum fermentarium]|uniref:hypothetical protein n=1 Tax=Azospirillum fermentarium TaxID=1233114 RepID=UPI002227D0E0|nr:hypothetical protein [Azospirillum fermentarium]MCW2246175.1 hypothetical protein [Azospirillum fermentarium]
MTTLPSFLALPVLAECAAALLVAVALTGIGRMVFALLRVPSLPCDSLHAFAAGWGVAAFAVAAAAMAGLSVESAGWVVLLTGSLCFPVWLMRAPPGTVQPLLTAVAGVLPVVLAAAAVPATQFDEFAHWLPNALYLFDTNTLPGPDTPNLLTGKQGYPIAGPLLTVLGSLAAGHWSETAAKPVTVLMAAMLAPVLASALTGRRREDAAGLPMLLTAVLALAVTLLNPFFDPRIAITTYSDTPTALLLAAAVHALWRAMEDQDSRTAWLWRAGFAVLALVQLRETNLGLTAGLAAAAALAGFWLYRRRGSGVTAAALLPLGLRVLGPGLAALVLWRLHLIDAAIGPDMAPRPAAAWDWGAPLVVARALLFDRLANNPLMGGAAALVAALFPIGLLAAWRWGRTGDKAILLLLAGLAGTQAALLGFAYIAVFSREEVEAASSAWRYAGQVGPSVLLALAVLAGGRGWRLPAALGTVAAGVAGIVLVMAVQTAGHNRWRLECAYAGTAAMRAMSTELLAGLSPSTVVAVHHPAEWRLTQVMTALVRAQNGGGFFRPAVVPVPPGAPVPGAAVLDLSAVPVGPLAGPVTARLTLPDGREKQATASPPPSCRR